MARLRRDVRWTSGALSKRLSTAPVEDRGLVLLGACRFLGAECMFACRTELAIFRMPEADPLSARAVQARSFAGNGTSTYKYCIK